MNPMNPTRDIIYKCPKGTRDYVGIEQRQRESIVNSCINTFRLYNVEPMDTPCFERTQTLLANSETSKQTFELVSKNELSSSKVTESEQCTLRYDQTMSFARFAKQRKLKKMRRYALGPVFRRDQPNMSRGRFRQFLQCDYDNLGVNKDIPSVDAETLTILLNILLKLDTCGVPIIKINSVGILQDLVKWCKIPDKLFDDVCRCLDKTEKQGWNSVKKQLSQIGVSDQSLVALDSIVLLAKVDKNDFYVSLRDLSFLGKESKIYIESFIFYLDTILSPNVVNQHFVLDITLARGLDYYTGLLFEVEMKSTKVKNIGSVAGGGRYDGLCGDDTQSIGFSLGIDRILKFLNTPAKAQYAIKVWIIQTNNDKASAKRLYKYRLWLLFQLRSKGISCGTEMKIDVGIGSQMRYVLKKEIPYIIFVGDKELTNQTVTLKTMEIEKQIEISLDNAIEIIK